MTGIRSGLTALVIPALVIVSCAGSGGSQDGSGPTVVATTTVLADVVENVVGGDARVEVLIPEGADAHDYRPSAAQIAAVNQADLVVANGLGLEEALADVLESASADGVSILELAPSLDPIPFGAEPTGEEARGSDDPHVWFDPLRMADAARLIAMRMTEAFPGTDWMSRAETYAADLADADERIVEVLSRVPADERKLVTNHDSLGYFADRYGFTVVGVIIPGGSTLGDPSSEELARLIEVMQREEVGVIFAETTRPSALAEAVASELGQEVEIVELYIESLGAPGSGADTLIGMLTTNAERIARALDG